MAPKPSSKAKDTAESAASDIHVYTGSVTDEEAETMLAKFLEEANASRDWLRNTLDKRGNEFLERWPNSVNERKSIFTRACKDMEQRKFPFIQAIYDQKDWPDRRKKFRNGLLLPYFNVETMAEDHQTFLSLLYNRSACEVGDFAHIDLELLLPGYETGLLEKRFNPKCVNLMPPKYGSLLPVTASESGMEAFPKAMLLFEAHKFLFRCLRAVLEITLHGIGLGTGNDKWLQRIAEGFPLDRRTLNFSEADLFVGAPPRFDMNYWTDQFLSHWYNAEEESRWLQHDPHYVQSQVEQLKRTNFIRRFKSDVQWCLLDQHTHAYPLSRALAIASIADVLRRLVRGITKSNLLDKRLFTAMEEGADITTLTTYQQEANDARTQLRQTYPSVCERIRDVFWETRELLTSFLLVPRKWSPLFDLSKLATGNIEAFSKMELQYWNFVPLPERISNFQEAKKSFGTDRLRWAILELSRPPKERMSILPPQLLLTVCADILPRDDEVRKARFENYTLDFLGDLALYCALNVAMRHPPSEKFTPDHEDRDPFAPTEEQEPTLAWKPNQKGPRPANGLLLKEFCETRWPTGTFDLSALKSAADTRTKLRAYWDGIRNAKIPGLHRDICEDAKEKGLPVIPGIKEPGFSKVAQNYIQLRLLLQDQTKEYQEICNEDVVRAKHEEDTKPPTSPGKRKREPEPKLDEKTEKFVPPQERKKPKTTGEAAPPVQPEPEPEPTPPPPPLKLRVPAASLSVFAQLWPHDSGASIASSGTIRWPDLKKAMKDAGWPSSQGSGSAVVFTKTDLTVPGPPHFSIYKPQDNGKNISHSILERLGRRLNRILEWDWKTFEPKQVDGI